ncbi:MerR family DNA-binding transcriptional regulator [Humibacter ginsenosidimutans]|uniref:MerR family DNA-binding transcriptional regulator n=1 Tax=Humibacter ginsenosidimutans TaxID=2599293 RepID=A0A5B8LYP6_9MICO|nr:MerR family DNA-binding transcriptional regulator [Humibacter ginsenosidimutans]QDZ13638.1 MerR family DNA-binding transcriptional regulator [Humibacter ginsenosidimutans]
MRIGEVATSAGVTVKTVRHYETLGLIRSTRLSNGYRDYGEDAPRLVAEAHALSRAGIRLEQTRPFLDCLSEGSEHGDDCVTTRPAYRAAIDDLTERIDELSRRRDALLELLATAEAREDAGCQFADARPVHEDSRVHEGVLKA